MSSLQTIDISQNDRATSDKVVEAARTLGFIYVSHHSIPRSLMRRVFALSSQLFKLSPEEKMQYKITPDNRGWSMIGSEKLDPATQKNGDHKEAFNIAPSSGQCLPAVLEDNRELLREFEGQCQRLCLKLCQLLATGLGLDPGRFSSKHNADKASGTIMRLLFYPEALSNTDPLDGGIRAGAHTDYGSLTLLFQNPDQSGLEVLDPSTGRFEGVPAPHPASEDEEIPVLVNIADQLTLWTAGQLKSTVHRVTSTYTGDRFSIAYFCHPDDDTVLEPIETLRTGRSAEMLDSAGTSAGSLTAGEHLRRRLDATYSY